MTTQRRPLHRRVARRATTVAVAAAAALATLLIVAAPARAANTVSVGINNLPSNVTPGVPSYFRVAMALTDKAAKQLSNVHAVITVHLDGMPADAVHVQRSFGSDLPHSSAGDGSVRFTDPQQTTVQSRSVTLNFLLLFSGNAPAGNASITVEAYQDSTRLGGETKSTRVRTGNGQGGSQAPTTPPNTNPGYVPTFAPGPTYSLAALPPDNLVEIKATVPTSLYWLGGLLVGLGVLLLFLIFRRQPGASVATPVGGPDDGPAQPLSPRPGWLRRPAFPGRDAGQPHDTRPADPWTRR